MGVLLFAIVRPLNILYIYRLDYSSSIWLFLCFIICNLFRVFLVILIYDSAYICRFIPENVRILVLFTHFLFRMRLQIVRNDRIKGSISYS